MPSAVPEEQAFGRGMQPPVPLVKNLDAVVLGGAAMDWVAQVKDLPPRDGLAVAHTCTKYPGGSAANVAVGLARLGREVGFVGKLGDDDNGHLLLHAFEEEGVDTTAVVVECGRPTASCFIGLDALGDRVIFSLPGASLIEHVQELDLTYVGRASVLYIGPAYAEVATAAATAAREAGGTVFYAPSGGWGEGGLADIWPVLGGTDVLLVSHAEARVLTGQAEPEEAVQVLGKMGLPVVIETWGQQGTWLNVKGRILHVPAFEVTGVRDTTGAGDAFAAGLMSGYLEGLSWEGSARLGSAAAALKIQQLGARSGLPVREEVTLFLESHHKGRRS